MKCFRIHAQIVAAASELEEDGIELGLSSRSRSSPMFLAVKSPTSCVRYCMTNLVPHVRTGLSLRNDYTATI